MNNGNYYSVKKYRKYSDWSEIFVMNLLLRLRLRRIARNHHVVSKNAIDSLRKLLESANNRKLENHVTVYNAALFIALIQQDLIEHSINLMNAKSKWHKQFAARGMAVLLYEASEDILEILGGSYRHALGSLASNDKTWSHKLNAIVKDFNTFKREHADFLKKIRTYVGAHKEKNALVQLDVLENLDHVKIAELGILFLAPLNSLVNYQNELFIKLKLFDE